MSTISCETTFRSFQDFLPENLGASQATIERNTFPHKYKQMRQEPAAAGELEKCTICLSEFEEEEGVR